MFSRLCVDGASMDGECLANPELELGHPSLLLLDR